jgi:IS30 family transposase
LLRIQPSLYFGLSQNRERAGGEKFSSYFWVAKLLKQMAHLTLDQRYQIEFGISKGWTFSRIASEIGKDKSVVSREINRNSDQRNLVYKADLAQDKTSLRHKSKNKFISFTPQIKQTVSELLQKDFSPEQIVGRCRLENIQCVCHETIYQFVWEDKRQGGQLYKHLRTKGKKYRKRGHNKDSRGIIPNRVDISNRPPIVEQKERFGDLEIDLVIGKKHKHALLTINDRATGCLFMDKVIGKDADFIKSATIQLLEPWMPLIHTITSDNGKEFAQHQNIAENLNIDFFFAKPYHSWERGANENLNGLIRQYFPKKHNFTSITKQQIKEVQNKLNNRPRKRLGFKTPNEILAEKLDLMASVAFIT